MTRRFIYSKTSIAVALLIGFEAALYVVPASADDVQPLGNVPTPNYDENGRKLPPGVPKYVDTNGVLSSLNHRFTTPAYQEEALKLVIQEANQVAIALKLPEQLPITRSNLTQFHVSPFGFAFAFKMIGNVTTKHYIYGVACDNKFNDLGVANYDDTCFKLREHQLPIKQVDTNAAYQLAKQWLKEASMDVTGLNRDCNAHVAVSPFWNHLAHLGDTPQNRFVPIYYVWWTYPGNDQEGHGGPASVELFAPTKTLLQLSVLDPKYILRKPIVFTNMAALFPGVAPIHTNYPVEPIVIDKPLWGTSTN